jgi:alpha-glucosidase (family GH31 glycosyl hydrolase)
MEFVLNSKTFFPKADQTSYEISDEFLIGNEILVAPITDEDVYARDVYLPRGNWKYENGSIFTGPLWLRNFPAPIEKIPYFIIN